MFGSNFNYYLPLLARKFNNDILHLQAKGLSLMNQAQKDSHVDNNCKDIPKLCQRYAKDKYLKQYLSF